VIYRVLYGAAESPYNLTISTGFLPMEPKRMRVVYELLKVWSLIVLIIIVITTGEYSERTDH